MRFHDLYEIIKQEVNESDTDVQLFLPTAALRAVQFAEQRHRFAYNRAEVRFQLGSHHKQAVCVNHADITTAKIFGQVTADFIAYATAAREAFDLFIPGDQVKIVGAYAPFPALAGAIGTILTLGTFANPDRVVMRVDYSNVPGFSAAATFGAVNLAPGQGVEALYDQGAFLFPADYRSSTDLKLYSPDDQDLCVAKLEQKHDDDFTEEGLSREIEGINTVPLGYIIPGPVGKVFVPGIVNSEPERLVGLLRPAPQLRYWVRLKYDAKTTGIEVVRGIAHEEHWLLNNALDYMIAATRGYLAMPMRDPSLSSDTNTALAAAILADEELDQADRSESFEYRPVGVNLRRTP